MDERLSVRAMYAAVRPHVAQCSVTRPPCSSSDDDRVGVRSTWGELQEGQTNGFWSRSAAIRISASGARYSLMPRRPTVGPSGGVWWHGRRYPTLVPNLPKPFGHAKVGHLRRERGLTHVYELARRRHRAVVDGPAVWRGGGADHSRGSAGREPEHRGLSFRAGGRGGQARGRTGVQSRERRTAQRGV